MATKPHHPQSLVDRGRHAVEELIDRGKHAAVEGVQHRVNAITAKARRGAKQEISASDRAFLKSLYYGIATGGALKGYPEASQLLLRYLECRPAPPAQIAPQMYQMSGRVKNEMHRQKMLVSGALRGGREVYKIEPPHIASVHMLFAEPKSRLFYANNRFWLHSVTVKLPNGQCETTWSVPDRYEFEDFSSHKHSDFEAFGEKLIIEDGLSKYLQELGMAKEFSYTSEWKEVWRWYQ